MTPVHHITRDMTDAAHWSKLRRPSYAGWQKREAEAQQRAEKLKGKTCTTWKH